MIGNDQKQMDINVKVGELQAGVHEGNNYRGLHSITKSRNKVSSSDNSRKKIKTEEITSAERVDTKMLTNLV